MGGAKGSATAAFIGAILLVCFASNAFAGPPIEYSGAIETSVASRQLPSDDSHEIISQVLAYSHFSSFLWEPWIATVSADFNAAFDTDFGGEFSDMSSLAGDFALSLLPASHYPVQFYYSAIDNRFDGDYSGSDYRGNRAGVSGRAAFNDQVTLDYLFSHDQIDRTNYGDLSAQRADATLRHTFNAGEMPFNITDIGSSVSYYTTNFDGERAPDNSGESMLGTIYYRAEPVERLNHDFRATLVSDKSKYSLYSFDRLTAQGVGTVNWRSPTNNYTAASAVRVLGQRIDYSFGQAKPDTDSALVSANGGVSWRPTDHLTMTVGARANVQHIETVPDERLGVLLEQAKDDYDGAMLGSIDYSSPSQEVGGFNWRWDARVDGDIGYRTRYKPRWDLGPDTNFLGYRSTTGLRSDGFVSIGHTFERSMELPWISIVNVTFLQEVGLSHQSAYDAFEPIVTHSASFTQGYADETGSSYFRLYLRDTHGLGDEREDFQAAQADYTRRLPESRNQTLYGNLSVQAVRQNFDQKYGDMNDFYISARADLGYEYRDVFGVDGLRFVSDIRINAIGLDDFVRDPYDDLDPDRFRNDWRNRLQYTVGQLWLSLEGTLFQEDGKLGHYVGLTGRRSFDSED